MHRRRLPITLIDIHNQFNFNVKAPATENIRKRAYLPNFKVIPANIIDPTVGASTCALGNHKCTKNMGIFTKNAIINLRYIKISSRGKASVHL